MMDILRTAASKVAALAILTFAVAAAYAWIAMPIVDGLSASRESIEQQRKLLGSYKAALEREPDATALETRIKSGSDADAFLGGESDAIRLAGLQSNLSSIAERSGVRLKSTLSVPPRELGEIRFLGIQVQLSAGLEQVQNIVFALETQQPYLFINSLQISRAPDSDSRAEQDLDVRLVVLGAAARNKS